MRWWCRVNPGLLAISRACCAAAELLLELERQGRPVFKVFTELNRANPLSCKRRNTRLLRRAGLHRVPR